MRERKRDKIKQYVLVHMGVKSPPNRRRKRRKIARYVAYKVLGLETEERRLDDSYKLREENNTDNCLYLQLMRQMSR